MGMTTVALGFLISAATTALMIGCTAQNRRRGWRRPERPGSFDPVEEALELHALLRRLEASETPVVRPLSLGSFKAVAASEAEAPSEPLSLVNLQQALGCSVQVAPEEACGPRLNRTTPPRPGPA